MANLPADVFGNLKSILGSTAHGEPVRVGDRTVIPVAFVTCGAGGGQDGPRQGRHRRGRGVRAARRPARPGLSGGGGGGMAIPLGAYIAGPDGVKFDPNPVPLVLAGGPGGVRDRLGRHPRSSRPGAADAGPPPRTPSRGDAASRDRDNGGQTTSADNVRSAP